MRSILRFLAILSVLVATAWLAAGGLAPVARATSVAARPAAGQDGPNRAALVVRFADGSVEQRCVAFSELSITGAELLSRSGLQAIMDFNSGFGGAVCSINGAGCAFPIQECFCKCQGLACEYWAYYHWVGSGWQYSQVGASGYTVTDGALEGWSWGPGNWVSGTEPPAIAFDQVCAAPATPTPTLAPTATAAPTHTPTMTATAAPTQARLPQLSLQVSATTVAPGACALLSWQAWDAEQVTLNGGVVYAHEQREVCPAAAQSYVLIASSAAGQVSREVVVQVLQPTQPTVMTTQPPATATQPPAATQPAPFTQVPPATISPGAIPLPVALPTATPTNSQGLRPGLAPVAYAQESLPTRPAQPTATAQLSPLPPVSAFLVAPATATPRPRRALGADGQPTPTPILVARVGAGPASATQAGSAGQPAGSRSFAVISRDFSPTLLAGYGAYLLIAAMLAGAGVRVVRRKRRETAHGAEVMQ